MHNLERQPHEMVMDGPLMENETNVGCLMKSISWVSVYPHVWIFVGSTLSKTEKMCPPTVKVRHLIDQILALSRHAPLARIDHCFHGKSYLVLGRALRVRGETWVLNVACLIYDVFFLRTSDEIPSLLTIISRSEMHYLIKHHLLIWTIIINQPQLMKQLRLLIAYHMWSLQPFETLGKPSH